MSKHYFTTPFGEAIYPWLSQPDTAFDKAGVFHLKIKVPLEEAGEFIDQLRTVRDNFIAEQDAAKQKNWNVAEVYEEEYDEEGNPTGNVIFKTKCRANVTYKDKNTGEDVTFQQKPKVVDMDENTVGESVWGGSVVRAQGVINPYAMASSKTLGVSLRLSAVQVKELVTGTGSGGFGDAGGVIPGRAQ